MKKLSLGFAAAALLGLAAFSAPASAFQAPLPGIGSSHVDTTEVQYGSRRMMRRGPVCTVRTVVTRGPYGRRVVKKIRTCRR
jgi:hypothetical protein